jgi:hypothetical protein
VVPEDDLDLAHDEDHLVVGPHRQLTLGELDHVTRFQERRVHGNGQIHLHVDEHAVQVPSEDARERQLDLSIERERAMGRIVGVDDDAGTGIRRSVATALSACVPSLPGPEAMSGDSAAPSTKRTRP